MWTTEDQTVAAGHSVDETDPARWQEVLKKLWDRVAGRFGRADLRRHCRAGGNAQVAVHLVYTSDTGRLVTGDEVYGASAGLRSQLEAPGVGYVLAVVCHRHVRFGGTTIGSTSYAGRFRSR